MDPYLQSAGNRGEGFRVDDIYCLDEFARQRHQLAQMKPDGSTTQPWMWQRIQRRVLRLSRFIIEKYFTNP